MAKPKKQSKADKAFIEKISTLNIGVKPGASGPSCPDCGQPLQPVAHLKGTLNGTEVEGTAYVPHGSPFPVGLLRPVKRKPQEKADANELSFSA
jgi:hypothetical protein